ncbi:MAG: 23S rRNA (uracil(1939)-C(5))-methyltransferase RlmD [Bacteroidales bacterium]|jgi:23S rRNA (uracil1939-C5)-methyltransferase|nr:23S rRNA (uracil(1939)-C(5))-methyltransferase RlmD [Bacteroidales bacterium]
MRKKKEHIIIENLHIVDAGAEGKAVGKHDKLTVFVPYMVPGDVADVKVVKKKRDYAEAILLNLKQSSPDRIEPRCAHFGVCGGCKWQVMPYERQLFYKQKQVNDHFSRIGKFEYPELRPIIASDEAYHYRNKLEFTFTNKRWLDSVDMLKQESPMSTEGVGFHIPGKFDKILDITCCLLQPDNSNRIRLYAKQLALQMGFDFYNARDHSGTIRNLILRNSAEGAWMAVVVFGKYTEKVNPFMDSLATTFPEINSLYYVFNEKLNDSINDLDMHHYRGVPYIEDKMENLTFRIGPTSFYQTNSKQAYRLYSVVRSLAAINPEDIVYDLYTGIGTIALFVAARAREVIGIEYVEAAIADARANAQLNQITNAHFFTGDMAKILTPDFIRAHGSPDIVITDPPRSGMHPKVIEQLLDIAPKRIVYVSCNPATQARDLTLLTAKYKITAVQPVDMFPQTQHVENVALLER